MMLGLICNKVKNRNEKINVDVFLELGVAKRKGQDDHASKKRLCKVNILIYIRIAELFKC